MGDEKIMILKTNFKIHIFLGGFKFHTNSHTPRNNTMASRSDIDEFNARAPGWKEVNEGAVFPVYKSECMYSFDGPLCDTGVYLNLQTFRAYGHDYVGLDRAKTGCTVYLHIKHTMVEKAPAEDEEGGKKEEEAEPAVLGIGVEGGFKTTDQKWDTIKDHSIVVLEGDAASADSPTQRFPFDGDRKEEGVPELSRSLVETVNYGEWSERRETRGRKARGNLGRTETGGANRRPTSKLCVVYGSVCGVMHTRGTMHTQPPCTHLHLPFGLPFFLFFLCFLFFALPLSPVPSFALSRRILSPLGGG